MIKQLMDAEKIRLNKFNSSKQIKLWTQEIYNKTNKDIANFIIDTKKDLELTRTTTSGSLISGSTSSFSWVKKAISGDTTKLDATATADAPTGNHSINVVQLAEGVNKSSSSSVENTVFGSDGSIAFEIKVNGATKSVTVNYLATDTPSTLAQKINTATAQDSDKTPLGLRASYDSTAKRFFLSTKSTGDSAQIKITSDANKIFTESILGAKDSKLKTDLNLYAPADPVSNQDKGKNAKIDFDGSTGIEYSSNQITINGINVSLKNTGSTTIKVDTDVDSAFNKIKGFVDKYNELIDKLNSKITEKRYRDYQPLTEEQKKAMDEDDVKLWEEKAKSGLLRNDEHISKVISNTRSGLYENVYDNYDSGNTSTGMLSGYKMITEIGITTGSYQEKGKLKIDETKLKNALANNPDGVMNLLFKTSDISESDASQDPKGKGLERRKESGIITRIYDDLVDGMKNIIDKSGTGDNATLYRNVKSNILIDFVSGKNSTKTGSVSLLDKDVLDIEKRIYSENRRLSDKENSYYKKFAALEKAMNQMNSQSSWLASQLSGGM